jgi:hypothetical protein
MLSLRGLPTREARYTIPIFRRFEFVHFHFLCHPAASSRLFFVTAQLRPGRFADTAAANVRTRCNCRNKLRHACICKLTLCEAPRVSRKATTPRVLLCRPNEHTFYKSILQCTGPLSCHGDDVMMLQASNELVRPRRARRLMDRKSKRNRCGRFNRNWTQKNKGTRKSANNKQ